MASRTESGEPDGGGRSTAHQMTKEEWRAEQERNLKASPRGNNGGGEAPGLMEGVPVVGGAHAAGGRGCG